MKEIKLDILTIAGIVLFLLGTTMLFIMYFNQEGYSCIADPVSYANNHSNNYWWDYVQPIRYFFPTD